MQPNVAVPREPRTRHLALVEQTLESHKKSFSPHRGRWQWSVSFSFAIDITTVLMVPHSRRCFSLKQRPLHPVRR